MQRVGSRKGAAAGRAAARAPCDPNTRKYRPGLLPASVPAQFHGDRRSDKNFRRAAVYITFHEKLRRYNYRRTMDNYGSLGLGSISLLIANAVLRPRRRAPLALPLLLWRSLPLHLRRIRPRYLRLPSAARTSALGGAACVRPLTRSACSASTGRCCTSRRASSR